MNLIKKIFKKNTQIQSVGAIRYPERILIETRNKIKNSYWICTDNITFLPKDATKDEIGQIINKHLDLSTVIPDPDRIEFKEMQERYKIVTGLKTIRAQMKDAKYVSIRREKGKLKFSPTINGGPSGDSRGYQDKPDDDIELNEVDNLILIGKTLNQAWDKCE